MAVNEHASVQFVVTMRTTLAHPLVQLLASGGSVAGLTALLLVIHPGAQQATASLLYILVVLIISTSFGLWPGLLTSVLAFLAFNFFLIYPYQAFGVTSVEDSIRLITFLGVAVLASSIAGHARSQALAAAQRASELAALYSLSQTISAEVALNRILPTIAQTTIQLLRVPACRILLSTADDQLIEHASAGTMAEHLPHQDVILRVDQRVLGVLQVARRSAHAPFTPAEQNLLQTLAIQIGLVLERARLADAAGHARALAESDRLKSTLLSSVSHDLRTPLAVIKGAVTNLLDDAVGWAPAVRHELLTTINEETDRLNRLVSDLLEMSRIEAGTLRQVHTWQDLAELIGHVVARLQPRLNRHSIVVDMPSDLPVVQISYAQIDHVLTNLLENAAQYTPSGTVVTVRARASVSAITVEVLDQGPGIADAMRDRIFEKFVRAAGPERHAEGSGLGLAICKGLIEAHGGQIWVTNRVEGGACFAFTLPLTPIPMVNLVGEQTLQ